MKIQRTKRMRVISALNKERFYINLVLFGALLAVIYYIWAETQFTDPRLLYIEGLLIQTMLWVFGYLLAVVAVIAVLFIALNAVSTAIFKWRMKRLINE